MKTKLIVLLSLAVSIMPNLLFAQFTQQGPKLVGTGAVGNTIFEGNSVAISSDGNTAIVGGLKDNTLTGAVWVFTRNSGVWTQQGPKLVGTGSVGNIVEQGYSVAVSSDGNTLVEGGFYDNNGVGACWVFTRSGGVWTQQGNKLVGAGGGVTPEQGFSDAISSDGNTVIVGGPYDNGSLGAVWVFTRSGGIWTQQGSKLVGAGAVGNAKKGWSVAISSDGNTAAVGGPFDTTSGGAIWVFTRSGGIWTQQGSKLVGAGAVGNAYLGSSVAISSDGNTVIVGGPYDNGGLGAVWVFIRNSGVWAQQTKLVGIGGVGVTFLGWSVAISSDGNTAIEGGPNDNGGTGALWVFTRSGNVWTQLGSSLVGTDAVGYAQQGSSVAISSEGTAVVGGPYDNGLQGAVWFFFDPNIGITPISNKIPRNFSLSQNYPNPFNPTSKFIIQISKISNSKVTVYDVLGREVVTLVNQQLNPGTYEVNFDGSNFATGIYLYKLQAGDFIETRKMILLK